MQSAVDDKQFMQRALELAERGRLTVSPNPMVGCVIVRDRQIIAEAYHQRAGDAHAEVLALQVAGDQGNGAEAFISLEPCCHHGRTPPCTDALLAAGIKKVTVACLDPNPLVAGQGVEQLKQAGVEVHVGLCEQQAKQLNAMYFHYRRHNRPYVIAKWAMSLDGKTQTVAGDSKQISSLSSSQHSHATRSIVDAIIIGANTAREDNPQLTTRYVEAAHKHPLRVVLTSSGKLSFDLAIFNKKLPGQTLIVTGESCDPTWQQQCLERGIEVLTLATDSDNKIRLKLLLEQLAKRGITSVLVEGGMKLHHQFFTAGLVDQVAVYIAPTIIGELPKKQSIKSIEQHPLSGDDLLYIGIMEEDPCLQE